MISTSFNNKPVVSIGLPVCNGEVTLEAAIKSLLQQSFSNFELIISDNASTDETMSICKKYAEADSRIRYVRQSENFGPVRNFQFVLDSAAGEYFMWAAADDIRSVGYIKKCLTVLKENRDYSFASATNLFEGEEDFPEKFVTFSIEGNLRERITNFMDNCWISHGCFYSLFRKEFLDDFPRLSDSYLAFDWSVISHLLLKGGFARIVDEKLSLGKGGASAQANYVNSSRTRPVHYIFPFYDFSIKLGNSIFLSSQLSVLNKLALSRLILKFNVVYLCRMIIGIAYRLLSPIKNLLMGSLGIKKTKNKNL